MTNNVNVEGCIKKNLTGGGGGGVGGKNAPKLNSMTSFMGDHCVTTAVVKEHHSLVLSKFYGIVYFFWRERKIAVTKKKRRPGAFLSVSLHNLNFRIPMAHPIYSEICDVNQWRYTIDPSRRWLMT